MCAALMVFEEYECLRGVLVSGGYGDGDKKQGYVVCVGRVWFVFVLCLWPKGVYGVGSGGVGCVRCVWYGGR